MVTATLNPLWRFRVTGTMPRDPRRPYVVVSNHESFVDILLISHLPWEMKWLSKVEILRIPVLGWNMVLAGDVPVERGTRTSALKAMRRCQKVLADKVSVMMFPEGTRSETDDMLPFKEGAFRLAVDSGVPILPVVVRGTGTPYPSMAGALENPHAEVRVLEPIETTGLTSKDVAALTLRVRNIIAAERKLMDNVLSGRSRFQEQVLTRRPKSAGSRRPTQCPASTARVRRYGSIRNS